jgi:hypothetical protein
MGLAAAQRPRDRLQRVRRHIGSRGNRQGSADLTAVVPCGIRRQDQGSDLSGRGQRCLRRCRTVRTYPGGGAACAYPMRHRAGEPLCVSRQRRIERAVISGVIADDIDHRRMRPPGVVHVGDRVGETGPAVEQGGRRLSGHARIAVGAAGHHGLGHAENAAHPFDLVEGCDEVHLGSARVGEAGVDAAGEQGADEALGAVHGCDRSGWRWKPNRTTLRLAEPLDRGQA